MKHLRKALAMAMAVAVCLGLLAVPAAAAASDSEFGGSITPVILIHGNTQSDVYLYKDDNVTRVLDDNGDPVKNWMPAFDIGEMVKRLIGPLLLSLLLQRDIGLTTAIKGVFSDTLYLLQMDDDGMPVHNMRVESYVDTNGRPQSLAECSEELRDNANRRLRINERDPRVSDDYIYYFAYDSFGNNAENTKQLAEYIKGVSHKHGGAKVSLVAISLGGTLINSLMHDYYNQVVPLLCSVIYVVAAVDGTTLVGDIYTRQLSVDNENLYRDMFPGLLEAFGSPGWIGYLLNVAVRLLPKKVLLSGIDSVIDVLVGEFLSRNTTLWSLVPKDYYEAARDMWLQGEKDAAIRAQTDHYYQAQKNSRANILRMRGDGVRVYSITNYDVPLFAIAGSYAKYNADSVLHFDSTSLGATAGYINTPLPADYRPVNPVCTDPDHNHMSPDGVVDASTGILPDQTWFFRYGMHDRTSDNDLAMRLIIRLATASKYETVYTMEDWPQFNYARESRWLRVDLLPQAEAADQTKLSEKDAQELAAAIAQAKAMLAKTVAVPGEYERALERLLAILVKLGLREAAKPDYAAMILDPMFSFINRALYRVPGPRGFFDPFWVK